MGVRPGTVSRILWHFTGGPQWSEQRRCQEPTPKPESLAYKALLSILTERVLRLGGYREVVKVDLPVREFNTRKKRPKDIGTARDTLESAPVCCLSDIPIMHLAYHAQRYGRFALGFYRESVVRHGFNPVLYTLSNANVIRALHKCIGALSRTYEPIDEHAEDLLRELRGLDVGGSIEIIRDESRAMAEEVDNTRDELKRFLAFVKTHDQEEFETIYCEREWRSLDPFAFSFDDLAMIVVPKGHGKQDYYGKLIRRLQQGLPIAHRVPVVPWDDLIDH